MQAPESRKKILIAPLDWGLGHATRCIPIIRECISAGQEIVICSSGRSLRLLEKEFPQLLCISIPSYNIYYQKSGSFIIKIIAQLNKVFTGIRREHRSIRKIIDEHQIGLIISDNRYGVYDKNIYSVIISHQMMVKIPGMRFLEWIVYVWLWLKHAKFDEVWIPDAEGELNLSGDLSHRYRLNRRTKFIGVLTRFQPPAIFPPNEIDVLVILSGPEPQRSIFEQLIISQAKQLPQRFVIVSGIAELDTDEMAAPNVRVISNLGAEPLYQMILRSEIILSRGGYSTLMDLAVLGKKCIFIPTPGQTEQLYIVERLREQGLAVQGDQENFNLEASLDAVKKIMPFHLPVDPNEFKPHLRKLMERIN